MTAELEGKGSVLSTSSEEDYLRTIYELDIERGAVRSVDVAKILNVSKPSVNKALSRLEEEGMVTRLPYSPVVLTEKGREKGEQLHQRYGAIRRFLIEQLEVPEERANEEAHGLEHALSADTVQRLCAFMDGK